MGASDVLIVRLGSLGDVVLACAAGQALLRARPEAAITFLVKQEYEALVRAQPWAHAVWGLPSGEERGAAGLSLWRERIREAAFSAVVDLQTSPRSRALLAGHPRVLWWRAARWQRRRWVSLKWTRPAPVTPAWRRFVDALAPLGVDAARAEPPRLAISAQAATRARAVDDAWPGGPIVFLAPGARWATKRWPEASWLEVAQRLVEGGQRVLLGGDAADRALLPGIAAWALAEPRARWFEGPLDDLAALVARAKGAVTNDTGLMHLAAAVGVRVVAVFGSTHPALGFAPAGAGHAVLCANLACQPCTLHGRARCPLGHHDCVRRISPRDVLEALARIESQVPGAALER